MSFPDLLFWLVLANILCSNPAWRKCWFILWRQCTHLLLGVGMNQALKMCSACCSIWKTGLFRLSSVQTVPDRPISSGKVHKHQNLAVFRPPLLSTRVFLVLFNTVLNLTASILVVSWLDVRLRWFQRSGRPTYAYAFEALSVSFDFITRLRWVLTSPQI